MKSKGIAIIVALLCAGATAPVTAQDRTQFDALVGLARVKRNAGDTAAARRYFDQAARLRPLDQAELAEYFWVLAIAAPREAIAVGKDLLRASPSNDLVRDRVITIAATASDEQTVMDLAKEGRRLSPRDARWPRRLAESFLRRGLASDAADAYVAAAGATGADVHDQVGLALACEAAGDAARASAAWANVPPVVRAEHPEWIASYLRVLAKSGPAAAAAV
jgi:predicted Zn-dependent protease